MEKVTIGFLPLYLKLYDDAIPALRPGMQAYCDTLAAALKAAGAEVVQAPICRIAPEFSQAVQEFEKADVDSIVTVHLAYSPSLEAIDALAATKLPILIMDTTRDYRFGFDVGPDGVSYNHGIHGVQDLCNLLRRRGKDFALFAGHFTESDVVRRVVDGVRAICSAQAMEHMRAGQIGSGFAGMGDFIPSAAAMERLGVSVLTCDGQELRVLRDQVTEEQLRAEYEKDCRDHGACAVDYAAYAASERIGLGVRKWLEKNQLDAFSMTFLSAGKVEGFDTMPFSESSKALARGIGYAGEGDVLTAALVGALAKYFPQVNFTELFCPDWEGNTIYLSHMGESNLALLENRRTSVKEFPYADGPNPVCISGHMIPGKVCIVNLLPNGEDWFDMIIARGELLQLPETIESIPDGMNGWFRPELPITEFLEKYSELGGTHHSALVYGVDAKSLSLYAKTLGMQYTIL